MLTAQCPQCQTRFKVSDAQLDAADGFVRCGRCAHVFNAREVLEPLPVPAQAARPAAPADRGEIEDFELELPDFEAPAPQPPVAPLAVPEPAAASAPEPVSEIAPEAPAVPDPELAAFQQALSDALRAPRPAARPIEPLESAPEPAALIGDPFGGSAASAEEEALPDVLRSQRGRDTPPETPAPEAQVAQEPEAGPAAPEDHAPARPSSLPAVLFALGGMLGLFVLAGQLVYLNRTRIAAEVPELRPTLEAACQSLGCTVPLAGDRALLRTEWSELARVPDHPGLVQFTAILKNHARYMQAWPSMELTLTDSDDRVLVRKVFPPKDWLPVAERAQRGIGAGAQVRSQLQLDTAALGPKQSSIGYSVNWLYP
ncbi:DUF3426 domain-containing protein [Crenobacter caeni]|uniref:DUF3426 domain-containing protein n=1 Tax=Crenobacter caeni TaxID=2705474 RepID=A0A6B2KW78_9NEIS|nr:DUF3426 domain-containing protein [Crenobacter caeni]NDV14289.1 DUF3426 domain-containing protein [Crenobacter caeni]